MSAASAPAALAEPIIARRRASIFGPPAAGRLYDLSAVRAEQLRRVRVVGWGFELSSMSDRRAAKAVARLAPHLPGLRYRIGFVVCASLAPATSLLEPRPNRGGRHTTWTDAATLSLVLYVSNEKLKNPRLGDVAALKALRKRWPDDLPPLGERGASNRSLAQRLSRYRKAAINPLLESNWEALQNLRRGAGVVEHRNACCALAARYLMADTGSEFLAFAAADIP